MTIHTDDTTPGTNRASRVGLRSRRARLATVGGLFAAGALALAACGSSSPSNAAGANGSTATGTGTSTSAAAATNATVHAASTSSGTVLENSSDMALYIFTPDGTGTQSKCTGACASAWPALTVASGTTPTAASGVSGTLATAMQSNGTNQVTYNGKLLYTFISDSPGKVTGNDVANFQVVKVSSSTANTNAGSGAGGGTTTPTTMASGGSGGYQY